MSFKPYQTNYDRSSTERSKVAAWHLEAPYNNAACAAIVEYVERGNPLAPSTPDERLRIYRRQLVFWLGKKIGTKTPKGIVQAVVESVLPLTNEEILRETEKRQQSGKLPVPLFKLVLKANDEIYTVYQSDLTRSPKPNAEQSK